VSVVLEAPRITRRFYRTKEMRRWFQDGQSDGVMGRHPDSSRLTHTDTWVHQAIYGAGYREGQRARQEWESKRARQEWESKSQPQTPTSAPPVAPAANERPLRER